MRVTVTGATGLIGRRIVAALKVRGDDITVLSRDPDRARAALGVDALAWNPSSEAAPLDALEGRDAVVHLAGAPVAQRWTKRARREIHESRELGTRNLVTAICSCEARSPAARHGARPATLVSSSAVGYYGSRGEEILTEESPAGHDFLAGVCSDWEREARAAELCDVRVVRIRTGVVLDPDGGALAKMLPFFRLGIAGPVAGGRQRLPWIHADDLVAMYLRALDDDGWVGPFNAATPDPPTNREFSKALGRVLGRPASAPVPGVAIKALYGRMAQIVIAGQRAVPKAAVHQDFTFAHRNVEEALREALR